MHLLRLLNIHGQFFRGHRGPGRASHFISNISTVSISVPVSSYLVVVLILSDSFGEAEVADLGVMLCDQQYVPGSEVPVDEVMLLQVLHPHRHLVDQLCDVLYACLPADDQTTIQY